LKFGQYVAATRLAANLGARNPNITTSAMLAGLAAGKSMVRRFKTWHLVNRKRRMPRSVLNEK